MKSALRLIAPELYREWERLARDFEPVMRAPISKQQSGVRKMRGMSPDDLLVWRGVIEAALPFQREQALALLRCRRAMLEKLVEAGIAEDITGTWQEPGDRTTHRLTSSNWVMVAASGQPLDWLIDLLLQQLTWLPPDGTKTVLSGINIQLVEGTSKNPAQRNPPAEEDGEETPPRPGRKFGTPSDQTADVLAPASAERLLNTEEGRPPKGRGRLTELCKRVRADLKRADHAYALSTIERAIRPTFHEWEKANPDK